MKASKLCLSVLAASLIAAPAAFADPGDLGGDTSASQLVPLRDANAPVSLVVARDEAHVDGTRVAYHAAELEIAHRDLVVARWNEARTRALWNHAVAHDHPVSAGYWAQQHLAAQQSLNEALGRFLDERSERDFALTDFRADWLHLFHVEGHAHNRT
jgi:hypothetical protein